MHLNGAQTVYAPKRLPKGKTSSMADTENYEQMTKPAQETVAEFDTDHRGFVSNFQHALHVNPALVPLIVLVVAIAIFGIYLGSRFFSPFALTLILQQVQIVGVLAAAQSLIILTAGIDLSVGAIAVLCSVVMGQLSFRYGVPPAIAVGLGLMLGTAIGAISGWLVSRVKLPPFIVTLGMWQIVLATNYLFSRNETIRSQDIAAEAPFFQILGTKLQYAGATFTLGVILMVLLVFLLAYALKNTSWGRHVYAVGDDPEAAELAGVNVHWTLMSGYMLAGFICALAA